jgi:hypothetical protein
VLVLAGHGRPQLDRGKYSQLKTAAAAGQNEQFDLNPAESYTGSWSWWGTTDDCTNALFLWLDNLVLFWSLDGIQWILDINHLLHTAASPKFTATIC